MGRTAIVPATAEDIGWTVCQGLNKTNRVLHLPRKAQ